MTKGRRQGMMTSVAVTSIKMRSMLAFRMKEHWRKTYLRLGKLKVPRKKKMNSTQMISLIQMIIEI